MPASIKTTWSQRFVLSGSSVKTHVRPIQVVDRILTNRTLWKQEKHWNDHQSAAMFTKLTVNRTSGLNVGLVLVHRLRCWPNINPTLGQCVLFAENAEQMALLTHTVCRSTLYSAYYQIIMIIMIMMIVLYYIWSTAQTDKRTEIAWPERTIRNHANWIRRCATIINRSCIVILTMKNNFSRDSCWCLQHVQR